jgi:putative membrane protein
MVLAHAFHWWFPFIPLVWIAVIALIFVILRPRRRFWDARRSGEAVLAERYARGEIDEAEFRRRQAVLRDRPS